MSAREAKYRLKLAEGFADEARHNRQHGLWRSCVSNSQLAAENAAKAVLGLVGPVGRTHDPGSALLQALGERRFRSEIVNDVQHVATCARQLGPQVHFQSDYGDEPAGQTPWDIFDQNRAEQELALAEEVLALARQLLAKELP